MALCNTCDDARDEYIGNGVQREYLITFEYYKKEDVAVAFWDTFALTWVTIPDTDWVFEHDTLIKFNTAPEYNQRFMIYRCTEVNQLPAEFYAGSTIKAQDLNNNFFVLKSAIEEAKCSIALSDGTVSEKDWDKLDDTITEEQQTSGQATALIDDEHIFDAAAIAARHDAYVQPNTPTALIYEQPGKVWNDTDNLLDYFWDSNVEAWVSFTKSGPSGPQGDFGPPGKVIVSDTPPVEYPSIGGNAARPLESGDQWFDSYRVLLYVYYIDNVGPGQWVAVSKPGPKGENGIDGGISEAPQNGTLYGRKDASWVAVPDTSSGVNSVLAGTGINILGTASNPQVNVKFDGTGADGTTLAIPSNMQLLPSLP